MKRSITCVGMTLGSAALIALGAGCSHGNRPAQAPPAGTTSPTFESNVPPGSAPSAPSGQEPPPGPSYENAPQPPGGAAGQPGQPPPGGTTFQPEPGTPPTPPGSGMEPPSAMPAPAKENERKLCDDLAASAMLHVEDVKNGVTIVAIPKAAASLASVRDDAQRVESTMRQHAAGAAASTPGSEACGLFAVARLPDVTTTLTEGTKSVRILVTTTNPAEVKDLRRLAREQVQDLTKTGHAR